MSILDVLIGKVAPYECLDCGAEGRLLCFVCSVKLAVIPERCYRCRNASEGFLTCKACRKISRLDVLRVATAYEAGAKALIWKLKLSGAQAAAGIMADRMAKLINNNLSKTIIVPVPTATSRARRRGYDQAKLLARELSKRTRLPYRNCLSRSGQTHQHGLSRRERLVQLAAAFRVRRTGFPKGLKIILVDDVLTTGATLEAAAIALKAAGADVVEAIVFAQPQDSREWADGQLK